MFLFNLLKYVNTEKKFESKQYHQKLKHDCSEDKVVDLMLIISKIITINSAFTC